VQRDLIIDCQYGSTGKGLFAGYLAHTNQPDTIAYAPSPNAGHTLYWDDKKIVHKMLPSGITSKKLQRIILGPGSLLDLDRLAEEYAALSRPVRLYAHKNAACVLPRHRNAEANGGTAPGSTRQGVGAAQAERILRQPQNTNLLSTVDHPVLKHVELVDTRGLQRLLWDSEKLQIESCQGYSLSVLHGQYPHVTCRDVTTVSVLADTGVPYTHNLRIYGAFRTYPIRVANRPESGEWSGPSYPDSAEITYDSIGQPQEFTTVTGLPRRLFTWSQMQAMEACVQNRIDVAFLNFAQYPPEFRVLRDIWERLNECTTVGYLGFGPRISDVYKAGAPAITSDLVEHTYRHYRRVATRDL